jgi:quercetin dioxygenase-like cupin family protein
MRDWALVTACATVIGSVPSAALAAPGRGVTGTIVAKGTTETGIKITTRESTDVVVRMVTIEPGASTGWHYHLGKVIAVVQSGALTRTLADCSVETSTAGQSFIEPAGPDQVHIGRNLGSVPVVLYLTYILPEGAPLAVDVPAPGCGGHGY